jgi:geranylgeranyl pyrophosphate synthase
MPEAASAAASDLLAEARERTDALLADWAERLEREIGGRQGEALSYALRTPGKRVRAALLTASYRAAGGSLPAIAGVAAAVETVHTYSLVHDDLPCMDDDDLRRGRPTTHRVFDIPTATRVGYLLVPVAARLLAVAAGELGVASGTAGAMARELFQAGGIEGMVGGQWLDLEAERRRLPLV